MHRKARVAECRDEIASPSAQCGSSQFASSVEAPIGCIEPTRKAVVAWLAAMALVCAQSFARCAERRHDGAQDGCTSIANHSAGHPTRGAQRRVRRGGSSTRSNCIENRRRSTCFAIAYSSDEPLSALLSAKARFALARARSKGARSASGKRTVDATDALDTDGGLPWSCACRCCSALRRSAIWGPTSGLNLPRLTERTNAAQ